MEIYKQELNSIKDMQTVTNLFRRSNSIAAAFDTETNGLHIIRCRPFIFQFGFLTPKNIYAFAIDLQEHPKDGKLIIKAWHHLVKQVPVYLAHNVKFDLHMLANIGLPYKGDNTSDTQFYIRFAHNNVSTRNGGIRLGLKEYCTKYIDPSAKFHEKELKLERSAIAKKYNQQLKEAMGWKMKEVDEFFKDKTVTSEDFPDAETYARYTNWRNSLPKDFHHIRGKVQASDVPYTILNRKTVMEYALLDIVWVLLTYQHTHKVVEARGTLPGLELENKLIPVLWEQERIGLAVDKRYIERCDYYMRKYIRQRRQDLIDYTGQEITANQHQALKNFFKSKGFNIQSTGDEVLVRFHKDYPDSGVQDVVDCVRELRTLEKWYTTYLDRFRGVDRVYTQFNQVGAASLRMSSDFQQFPKKGIVDKNGRELFNPRRAIKTNGEPMVYLDYSQIELRVQALYTVLVGHPDRNLCRAYMPYQCVRGTEEFDYRNPEHLRAWNDHRWVLSEDPSVPWKPTDVHGATAQAAFNIDESHPDYKQLRSLGKTVNFAKNFGAQRGKIAEMFPQHNKETIDAIDQGYYKAFPGIKHYQNYCYQIGNYQQYATNLFGIRYWNVSGHNLINMLIQGSAATLLKDRMVAVYEYIKEHGLRTRMVMPVHDEVQFSVPEAELGHVPKLKQIMEHWPDSLVPIVVDIEISRTNWAEKEEIDESSLPCLQ